MAELLIVDDEKSLRENLKALFVGEGYEVRTAADGESALRKFAERRPDLVLTDLMMPKLKGHTLVQRLRGLDRRVPIILLTAYDTELNEARAMNVGADDFISKSADGEVLRSRVARALERVRDFVEAGPGSVVELLPGLVLDCDSFAILDGGTEIARLTQTEYGFLRDLLARRGAFCPVDELIRNRRGEGYVGEDSMLYVHICNLRKKLGRASVLLETDRQAGYRLAK